MVLGDGGYRALNGGPDIRLVQTALRRHGSSELFHHLNENALATAAPSREAYAHSCHSGLVHPVVW